MICPVLDALSHLTLELKQARDEVLRLCCVCFHFLVYYGFQVQRYTLFPKRQGFPVENDKKDEGVPYFDTPSSRMVSSALMPQRASPLLRGQGG